MSITLLTSFALYCLVTSITPGPNNIMLISSGINFGFKKTIPHILGIGIGIGCCIMFICLSLFVSQVLSFSILFYELIKIIGIFYLLYLSYKIIQSSNLHVQLHQNYAPFSFI